MSDRPSQLILIDDDPIFRLGLRTALESCSDLQIMAEADTVSHALLILAERGNLAPVKLVILEISIGTSILECCQPLKQAYPQLLILLFSARIPPAELINLQELGIAGYCPKGTSITELIGVIQQLLAGSYHWQSELTVSHPPISSSLIFRIRQSGLQQIEKSLAEVEQLLGNPQITALDTIVWSGQRRELLAARWLVRKLLPVKSRRKSQFLTKNSPTNFISQQLSSNSQIIAVSETNIIQSLDPKIITNSLFDRVSEKLQFNLVNLTNSPLEIDILPEAKKRELLYLVVRQLENILDELRFSQIHPDYLSQKLPTILQDLWQAVILEFFGKYYTVSIKNQQFEVVNILLQDWAIVWEAVFKKVPLSGDLLTYLIFQTPLIIDNTSYEATSLEAMARAEVILQNLILQVANGVVQPLLNNFADVETIKQSFCDRRFLSIREMTRFRNNLSWKYRLEKYINEPKAVFESRHELLILTDSGIKKISIYSPRIQELEKLSGIQLAVTLVLETNDAIAPRLRSAATFIGSGVVYILTQIIGRGIGLIGKGIIQGIGNTFQESRFGKPSDRQK